MPPAELNVAPSDLDKKFFLIPPAGCVKMECVALAAALVSAYMVEDLHFSRSVCAKQRLGHSRNGDTPRSCQSAASNFRKTPRGLTDVMMRGGRSYGRKGVACPQQ